MMRYHVMPVKIGKDCFIADTAVLIGDVEIKDRVAIFDGVVLRGDLNSISVGEGSNIQDNVTFHTEMNHATVLGKNVSVGHNAVVHGAHLGDNIIVGMGAIVMNGSDIGTGSVIAAGTVVTENFVSGQRSLIAGVPGKMKRTDDASLEAYAIGNARSYDTLRQRHIAGLFQRVCGKDLRKID